ncbi:S1/P1 nuclease [Tenacibaculum sp. 190130A14a]|uniref:Nuclease S1 n=1 Tax=Tenacibaculum polynesiense TaxID=3137857 RepID=A0ABP1ESA9_9FLAO
MRIQFYTVLLVSFLSVNLLANNDTWGPTGHRATGKIAEKHLTKKAKRKIEKLLQGESLAFVSTYADEIKSDRKKYGKFYTWHYVNMPLDMSYEESPKNPKGDLISGIKQCVKVLKDENSSVEDKRFYLKMLVHLMGDLHQPMHVGRKEDKGGNTIQVQWHGRGSNLHRVWDEDIIKKWGMSYVELADNAKHLSKEQIKFIQKGDVLDWMKDTHSLTKKVYGSAKSGDKLRYRYSYDYFPIVREQLQKGGIRLAKILNDIFC